MDHIKVLCAEEWSFDKGANMLKQYSSPLLRQRLIDELKKPSYTEHMGALCRANPTLAVQLRRITMSKERMRVANIADHYGGKEYETCHGIELLLAVMLRQRHYQMNHFLPACLSLIALRCRVPVLFWTLLSEQGILYSRNWTKDIALELGKQLMPMNPIPGAVGAHTIFDNLAKYKRTNMQHIHRENVMLESNQWTFVNGPFLMYSDVHLGRQGEQGSWGWKGCWAE